MIGNAVAGLQDRNPQNTQLSYTLCRGLIGSCSGGSHCFVSEGVLTSRQVQIAPGVMGAAIQDRRSFEGWRHAAE